jgi:hypothetical protein
VIRIDILPDDVLLEIFEFYIKESVDFEEDSLFSGVYKGLNTNLEPYPTLYIPGDWNSHTFIIPSNFFYSYRSREKTGTEAWQSLVHVCRRWRSLVLASPRHLNLQLCCTPETPAKDTLDVWPALPLIVTGDIALSSSTDNVIAAFGQSDRVCKVHLELAGYQVEEVLAQIQVPFPELTDLRLFTYDSRPVIPHSFLDGSAPRL